MRRERLLDLIIISMEEKFQKILMSQVSDIVLYCHKKNNVLVYYVCVIYLIILCTYILFTLYFISTSIYLRNCVCRYMFYYYNKSL